MNSVGLPSKSILFLGFFIWAALTFAAWKLPVVMRAPPVPKGIPAELREVGITEHLGEQVSIENLEFSELKDGKNQKVLLSEYFKSGRPILLTPVYYECPNLCNFLLNGLVKSLRTLDWTPGKQFDIVSFSINPKETPALADQKKISYLKAYERPEAAAGWHFLTGDDATVRKLANEVGFGYRYDTKEKQYAHSAVLIVLTPTGKISRYLYGIDFKNKDLRLALLEASSGKIGNVVDKLLLFCFRYDPETRKYSIYLTKLMQAGCLGSIVVMGGYLMLFWRRQRKGA